MSAVRLADGRMTVFVDQSLSSGLWSPLGTIMLAFIEAQVAGWQRAVCWFLLINVAQIGIFTTAYRYRQARANGSFGHREAQWLVAATFLVGLAWGSSVYFFWIPGQYVFYLTNLIVLVGVTGVCIVVLSPIRRALALFASATMLLPVLQLFFVDGYHRQVQTAVGLIAMMGFSIKYGRMAENQLTTALSEAIRNEMLAGELAKRTKALEIAKAELSETFAVTHIGNWVYHFETDSIRFSPESCQIFGVPEGTVGNRHFLINHTYGEDKPSVKTAWINAFDGGVFDHEHRIVVGSTIRWVREKGRIEFDAAGAPVRAIGITQDITSRKRADEEIKSLAFYDPLTLLPNRRLMLDRLRQALINSVRQDRSGALLLIDLDDFKLLNDTLGHDVGDRFLVEVGRRLQACVREGDTVARQGGDEFVVVLEGLRAGSEAATQAQAIALKINLAIGAPYLLPLSVEGVEDTQSYRCTSSIGIAIFDARTGTSEELMKRADTAMYHAKRNGRNTFQFFDSDMQQDVALRAKLSQELHEALHLDQFILHYQPQIDQSGQTIGAEALIRWRHPERGLIAPNAFIAEAEARGLIAPIGLWVLETACAQLAAWQTDAATSHLTLAVNVSARQFRQLHFVHQTQAIVARSNIDPRRLKLELTESLLLDDVEETINKMTALRSDGITFSLDDFGTGYSSLSYLKRLPFDQIKIDRAFVRDILEGSNDTVIATTIITLADQLGLSVIAEGVETIFQREFLINQGCRYFQGFLFSKPLSIDDFARYMLKC